MKNSIPKISIIIILILLSILIYSFSKSPISTQQVCINSKCFNIEIAQTTEELQKGLMYRQSLNENAGMLFIFDKDDIYSFWMKNTLIPLDIIWINKDNQIVYIASNVQPCKADSCAAYSPEKEALYVLEINAGLSEKYGFKEGDEAVLP